MLMRALVRDADQVRLAECPRAQLRPGWMRIRVLLAGICRTDLYAAEGLFPMTGARTLGHELAGAVLVASDASAFRPGDRVTVAPLIPCEDCSGCRHTARCRNPGMLGVDVDGGFADEVVVPESCVVAVPRELPLRRAAYVEPIAASLAVLNAPIRPDDRGAILGTGRIATLTARILAARGFRSVTMLDEGARAHATRDDLPFDFVIETSATEATLRAALRAVRPGGVVVLKSRPAAPVPLQVTRAVHLDVTLSAVGYGSFADAVTLARELDLEDLLGDVFPLESFALAFARARDANGGPKLFLAPDGER